VDASLDSESASAAPSPEARVDEPTLDEVVCAIKKLKNGRAVEGVSAGGQISQTVW